MCEKLLPLIPQGKIVVAESGISDHADCKRLAKAGVEAFLVGEALMRHKDVAGATRDAADGNVEAGWRLSGQALSVYGRFQAPVRPYGGTSTRVPTNRNSACCSGPVPSLRKAPTSMCDKRPPEGALG